MIIVLSEKEFYLYALRSLSKNDRLLECVREYDREHRKCRRQRKPVPSLRKFVIDYYFFSLPPHYTKSIYAVL